MSHLWNKTIIIILLKYAPNIARSEKLSSANLMHLLEMYKNPNQISVTTFVKSDCLHSLNGLSVSD